MKQVFKKISFQIGDLIVDTKEVKSGLVVGILIKHIKVLWEGKEVKISKWLLNNKVFKQEYKHLPRTRNNRHIK
jgi:hypothetical protein